MSRYLVESLLVELGEAVGREHLYDGTFRWEEGKKEKIMETVDTKPPKKQSNAQRTDAQKTPVIRLKRKREAEAKETSLTRSRTEICFRRSLFISRKVFQA